MALAALSRIMGIQELLVLFENGTSKCAKEIVLDKRKKYFHIYNKEIKYFYERYSIKLIDF